MGELSFGGLLAGMLRRGVWIGGAAIIAAVAVFVWSKRQLPLYRADVEFVYAASPDKKGGGAGGMNGVAAILGGFGGSGDSDKAVALARLLSRSMLAGFVERHDLRPSLSPQIWNADKHVWTVAARDVPTALETADLLRHNHLTLKEDTVKGTIDLALELHDRSRVAPLVNDLLASADAQLRAAAQVDSRRNLRYLSAQLANSDNAGLRSSIVMLMESELQRQTLADTGPAYAFRVIDSAIEPRLASWPRPTLFAVVSGALALLLGCILSAGFDLAVADRRR